MNRDNIICKLKDKIQDGYLNIKPFKLSSCDNCLEVAGKVLLALTEEEINTNKDFVLNLVKGAWQNCLVKETSAFIPRTLYKGEANPNIIVDPGENRWEKYDGIWYRTDVSYSQFTYLLQGLRNPALYNQMNLAILLVSSARVYLDNNNFVIKRIDGKPAENGSFNIPWPNVQLRKYFLKEAREEAENYHDLLEVFWYGIMRYLPWGIKGDNGMNTMLLYYSIGLLTGFSKQIKKKILTFIDKWIEAFVARELKDEVHWLLLNKIRTEMRPSSYDNK